MVRVSAEGRGTVEQHASVGDGERALVEVTLPPSRRTMRIDTVPSGALIYVNGVLHSGQTPQTLSVDNDEFYQLTLEKDGFELAQKAITPDDREAETTVNLVPDKGERGTLMLDSDTVAEVWIDGHSSGFYSPTMFRLPAGEHTVQLHDGDEARSPAARVRIKPGRATQLSLKGTRG